jgi:Bardet-Biedl syndrome 9 protein
MEKAVSTRLEPTWVCNLGEQPSNMVYHYNKLSKKNDIVVTGEQTFFVLNEADGRIRYQRRLEYTPSCIKTYHVPHNKDVYENEERTTVQVMSQCSTNTHDSPCFSFIMGSFSQYLMVYKDVQLVWTAKTQSAPIYVNTARFEAMEGLLVTLSDNGWLQLSCLGTDAPL